MGLVQGDVVRVDAIGDIASTDLLVNSYQFRLESANPISTGDVLDDLLEAITEIINAIRSIMAATTAWRRITAQNLSTSEVYGTASFATPIFGSAGGDPGISGGCAVINFPTTVPRVILRKFYGPVAENQLDTQGRLAATPTIPAVVATAAVLTDDIVTTLGTYRFGVLSPKTGTWVPPTAAVITNVPGYQRRRKPGVGA